MKYTPAGIDLLVAAARRRERAARVDAMHDLRAAMAPDGKALERRTHYLQQPPDED